MALLKLVSGQKPRQIAARVLQQRRLGSGFVEDLLENALHGASLSPADRGLCQEITYGVVRWQAALDWLIARKTSGREQKPALQNLLRLGLYQIFWLDRIPDHAAVNETVELAKQNGFGSQAGFVNAVLRGYLREQDETKKLLAGLKISQPALGWSHPEWLVARWQKRWGIEKTASLLAWNNTPPKTFARVNTLKFGGTDGARLWSKTQPQHAGQTEDAGNIRTAAAPHTAAPQKMADVGDLLARWRDENVEYDFVRRDWLEENLVFELKSHPPLNSLASFRDGWFYIQDPGTLLAVCQLGPQPGETILDFCAAPGGKTTFIAQLMNNHGRIVAQDVSEERQKWIQENCARLGVTCVEFCRSRGNEALTSNSGKEQRLLTSSPTDEKFDRILVDAPCSNTGVMRRRVDLRWRIQPEEIERLRAAQLDLLKQAATQVKPGGVLVYSTCSLEPEENGEIVKQFLGEHADFKLESERELLPFVDGVDGAYVARILCN
ncbi:MAG: 16S rRNA (cytosine(967)-C(5))-methyltransferase RsmB [Verrucomicrobiia bacterium]|jgi:16S rRNA (cytosine967-C5)-methyltransferase